MSGTSVDFLSVELKMEHDIVTENDSSHVTLLLLWLFPIDLSTCNTPEYPVVTYKFVGSISRK